MAEFDREILLDGVIGACLDAGTVIWRHFEEGFEVLTKADSSPVTAADHAAEAILLEALGRLAPGVPVVAEEEVAAGRIPDVANRFFLVDPLDGTRDFVRKGTDFTVNVGLIEDGSPTLGVVYAPARARLFVGDVLRGIAWSAKCSPGAPLPTGRTSLRTRTPPERWVAAASKSHDVPATEAYLAALGRPHERVSVGSSLKFGLVAAGEVDLYPRPSPTSEWDTAAGDAVLRAAGGRTMDIHGAPFRYGKPGFHNPGFVATGGFDAPPIAPFMTAPAQQT